LTSKTLLKKCRQEKRELLILTDKLEQLQMSLLPRAIQLKDINVQESGDADPLADRVSAKADLEQDIRKQIAIMLQREAEAYRLISKLRNSRQRQMLELYYLTWRVDKDNKCHLYTWEEVAFTMGISERWLWKQIPNAFQELKKIK
jgi:hypothetical protein